MQLVYYNEKLNFGDALNELVLKNLLHDYLDDKNDVLIYGIGTLLGLIKPDPNARKIYVFSSGCGYVESFEIDHRYHFICVRGPLTAKKLNLPLDLAVSDGAVLLRELDFKIPPKEYKWSYIPHWTDDLLYSQWPELIIKAGGHYIDPKNNPDFVINEILKSELVLAEAMHGAIVADTFRVPWVAIRAYKHINHFKWKDWSESMNLFYAPVSLPAIFNKERIESIIEKKAFAFRNHLIRYLATYIYRVYQNIFVQRKLLRILRKITRENKGSLSQSSMLELRHTQLKEKLNILIEQILKENVD